METSLHRQLKLYYGGTEADVEVQVDGYRIDAVVSGRLYEVQQASLAALRDKVRCLLVRHQVVVVKPLISRKFLIRRDTAGGDIISSRFSPIRESIYHLFEDLVHFVGPFPHPNLTLEVVLTEQEEHRVTRKRRRRFGPDYRVEDRSLVEIVSTVRLKTAADLRRLIPKSVPKIFTTSELATEADIPRWLAQKMAYCLRKAGAIEVAGKVRNSIQYRPAGRSRRAA